MHLLTVTKNFSVLNLSPFVEEICGKWRTWLYVLEVLDGHALDCPERWRIHIMPQQKSSMLFALCDALSSSSSGRNDTVDNFELYEFVSTHEDLSWHRCPIRNMMQRET